MKLDWSSWIYNSILMNENRPHRAAYVKIVYSSHECVRFLFVHSIQSNNYFRSTTLCSTETSKIHKHRTCIALWNESNDADGEIQRTLNECFLWFLNIVTSFLYHSQISFPVGFYDRCLRWAIGPFIAQSRIHNKRIGSVYWPIVKWARKSERETKTKDTNVM